MLKQIKKLVRSKGVAYCADCDEALSLFDIFDYVDLSYNDHCVCGKCLSRWVDGVGNSRAKELVIDKRGFCRRQSEKKEL